VSLPQSVFHYFLRNEILQDMLHESSVEAGKAAVYSILSSIKKRK